ncbi:MAG: Tol-Pal system beta propeller repeat protein TolB [Acidobacteria bacterium]|nr:Tol-Pal system beta propeller repeat protein TolB [Acidobacteriota bacterium]
MKRTIVFLMLIIGLPVLAQQEFELTLSTKGLDLIEIGIAGFTGDGADAVTKENCRKLLSRDLQLTGVFHVIPEKNMNLVPSPAAPENVKNCEAFLSVGAKVLITGEIRSEKGGQILFTGVVTDAKTCKKIITRRYRGETGLLKKLIHSFADDVIFVFTGKRGITNSRIAFVSDRTGHREIFIMDYNGDDLRQLTKINSTTIFPAISPDRKRIAFTSFRNHNPDLFLMTVGKGIETIYHAEGIGSTPDFSPDGKWLLFSASKDGNTDIYVYNIATKTTTRLTHHIAIDTSPRFSPNGKEIVFTSDRYGAPRIYVMDRDGLNIRRLNTMGSYNDSPAWSPDGSRVAYVAMFNNKFDIFIYNIAADKNIRLTHGDGSNEYPAWSPDGRRIVFSSNRSGSWQLYSMNVNGTGLLQLTKKGNNTCPFWVR